MSDRRSVARRHPTLPPPMEPRPLRLILYRSSTARRHQNHRNCGSSSSSTDSASTITGTASKGPVDSATVTAYALNSDGSRGQYLGMTTTDAAGDFSLEVEHDGPASLVVTGGTYADEASGQAMSLGQGVELETFLASVKESGRIGVTALTTIAASRAATNASAGLADAIASANMEVSVNFGLEGAEISMVPEHVLVMIAEMGKEFADGTFDGRNIAGERIEFAAGIGPEEALLGLENAKNAFLNSGRNASGMEGRPQ